jgi:hypothetical protein
MSNAVSDENGPDEEFGTYGRRQVAVALLSQSALQYEDSAKLSLQPDCQPEQNSHYLTHNYRCHPRLLQSGSRARAESEQD